MSNVWDTSFTTLTEASTDAYFFRYYTFNDGSAGEDYVILIHCGQLTYTLCATRLNAGLRFLFILCRIISP